MARAENARDRSQDDVVDAAGCLIDSQAWWSERMQESSTDDWKQKRVQALGKSQRLRKRGKLLQYAKSQNTCNEVWTSLGWLSG